MRNSLIRVKIKGWGFLKCQTWLVKPGYAPMVEILWPLLFYFSYRSHSWLHSEIWQHKRHITLGWRESHEVGTMEHLEMMLFYVLGPLYLWRRMLEVLNMENRWHERVFRLFLCYTKKIMMFLKKIVTQSIIGNCHLIYTNKNIFVIFKVIYLLFFCFYMIIIIDRERQYDPWRTPCN